MGFVLFIGRLTVGPILLVVFLVVAILFVVIGGLQWIFIGNNRVTITWPDWS